MVQGFQRVDEWRAVEVRAYEELVGQDDGMELGPIAIHLPVVGLRERLVFYRVKQNLRFQCLHGFFPGRELASGIKSRPSPS